MAKAETVNPRSGKAGAGAPPSAPAAAPAAAPASPPAAAPASASASPPSPLQPFEEAYNACLEALAEGQKELCSRQEQDYRAFLEAVQEPQKQVQRTWSEAQQDLQQTWQTLTDQGGEAGRRWEEAWRDAAERVMRAQQDAQEQLLRIQNNLAEAQKADWNEACRRSEEALRNYVRALQGALRGIDASTFDLTLLAPVGQSLITISGWAAGLRTTG